MKPSEQGFTLIELLVAIAIIALIAGAATMATFQVINVTKRSNDHMTVIRQVQNAGYWISHDALMAQSIMFDDPETTEVTEVLILSWTNWDGVLHGVTYDITGDELRRSHSVDGGTPVETLVAQFITSVDATLSDNKIKVIITATVADATEERTYEVKPRPSD